MDWLEITVTTTRQEQAEILEAELGEFAHGDEGVATRQLGDPEALDPDTLRPEIDVNLFVRIERDCPALRQEISEHLASLNLPLPEFRTFHDEDWEHAWKKHHRPIRIGQRLLIQPSWLPLEPEVAAEELIVIEIDPGPAFGTGGHETTQLCMTALEDLVRPGDHVLDLGTGSGILAIASSLLGSGTVLAIDNDARAIKAAEENVDRNGVAPAVDLLVGSLSQAENRQFDLIFANILAPVLHDLLEESLLDHLRPGGHLILSGILEKQLADMLEDLTSRGAVIESTATQDRWSVIVATT
jgi:ribosomal protein L11 methyltransferase